MDSPRDSESGPRGSRICDLRRQKHGPARPELAASLASGAPQVRTLNQGMSVKHIDLQFVKDTLSELDLSLDANRPDEFHSTALVLFSALVCGPNTARLAEFTQLPREFVESIRQRMIPAELWTEIDVCCDHWFGAGNLAFSTAVCLDVLIAQGLVVPKWDEQAGDYKYYDSSYSPSGNDRQQRVN